MGTRAKLNSASVVLRSLRGQCHSTLQKQSLCSPGSLAASAATTSCSVEDGNKLGQGVWHVESCLLDPEASGAEFAQRFLIKDLFGRPLKTISSSPDGATMDWSAGIRNGSLGFRVQHWTSEKISKKQVEAAALARDWDLRWRTYNEFFKLTKAQNASDAACLGSLDIDGPSPLTKSVFPLLMSSPGVSFQQEPSLSISMELSSVKRKRKKKMNKHKQRKLRRRDRHRN